MLDLCSITLKLLLISCKMNKYEILALIFYSSTQHYGLNEYVEGEQW